VHSLINKPNPSSPDTCRETPVLPLPPPPPPPLEAQGPLQDPLQHLHVPHLATGHPVLVSSQHNVHDLAMNIPPSHDAHPHMPFYPQPFPHYPHIPPYGASTGMAHQYMARRHLSYRDYWPQACNMLTCPYLRLVGLHEKVLSHTV
jgi:hypothetical protein